MILTYFKRASGKIDEVMAVANRVKPKDLQTASIILDFRDQVVLKCVIDGKSMPKEWDTIVAYYYKHYQATMERLFKEIGYELVKEEIIKLLMADKIGLFKEIWRLLLFAAQVGIKNKKRELLKAVDTGKGIDQTTFGNCPAWPGILYLMTLAESGSSDVLAGTTEAEDIRISIFQEYANGGLSILNDFFSDRTADLDGILAFIETQSEEKAKTPNLDLAI